MMAREFLNRREYLCARLAAVPGISCYTPLGAFYAFPDLSRLGVASDEFAIELLEKALVAVVPGRAFGCDSNIRLSFATSMENLRKGMDRIEAFISGKS